MERIQRICTIILILAFLAFFSFFMIRNAWLCDDAFITFRTADNFVNGFGLTWNTDERVQVYTHPLWMFFISFVYSFTREIYFTVIIFSIVVSLCAVAIYAFGIACDWRKALVGITLLCLSKAFMDYTTSGLENPLSYLLFTGFFFIYYRFEKQPLKPFLLSLFACLCAVNRFDTILFFVPVLVYEYISSKQWIKCAGAVALGFLPLICWTGFSFFYYGFPFPNPFYAKLNTGIDYMAVINQGGIYFLDSMRNDPITILVILIGVLSFFFTKDRRTIPVSLGIFLYLVYIVIIGGGFMSGRFFAIPFFCSVLIFSFAAGRSFKMTWAPALCLAFLIGLRSPLSPVLSDENYKNEIIQDNGIADERGFYYQGTGLLHALKNKGESLQHPRILNHPWIKEGKELKGKGLSVVVRGHPGMMGFFAGPDVHFIDFYAITEPFLARIHISNPGNWRIGHFMRDIPRGYVKTIETGKNVIQDEHLARFYNKLSITIKGNLFSPGRFNEIWNLNTGKYIHLLSYYRNEKVIISLKDVSEPKNPGNSWDIEGAYLFPEQGIHIKLGRKYNAVRIEMSLAYNYAYEITYYKGWVKIKNQVIFPRPGVPGKLSLAGVEVPLGITKRGFTDICIRPFKGNGRYSIGHILLEEKIK